MEKIELITKNLNKVFSYKFKDEKKTEISTENLKGFMDLAKVFMVIPKYEELKTFITENFEVSETDKIPELDYNKENSGTSKYSSEYAKVLFSIAKNTNDNFFKISVAENYPLKVETKEYIFILAPRVEND